MRRYTSSALLVVFAVCGALTVSAKEPTSNDLPLVALSAMSREVAVQKRYEASLMSRAGVVGVGLAYRDGRKTLLVLTDRPLPAGFLPEALDGVPVTQEMEGDVIPFNGGSGCIPCHAGAYSIPTPMGVSTGPQDLSLCDQAAGTLGFKACDLSTGDTGYVTCSHVVTASANRCPNGPLPKFQIQPARYESYPSCNPGTTIGEATKLTYISNITNNTTDAAFAVSSSWFTSDQILDIGIVNYTAGTAQLNACVRKSGRTTGLTYGRIDAVNVTRTIHYCANLSYSATFVNQIRIKGDSTCGTCQNPPCTDFSRGGDSGSAIVYRDGFVNRVVGLLFAGTTTSPVVTYANDIDNVLNNLDLTLDLTQCN